MKIGLYVAERITFALQPRANDFISPTLGGDLYRTMNKRLL